MFPTHFSWRIHACLPTYLSSFSQFSLPRFCKESSPPWPQRLSMYFAADLSGVYGTHVQSRIAGENLSLGFRGDAANHLLTPLLIEQRVRKLLIGLNYSISTLPTLFLN